MTPYLTQDTWYVQENYGRQGATAYLELVDEPFQTAPHQTAMTLACKPLSTIELYDTTLGETIFGGLLTNPVVVFLAPTLVQYQLNCRDYTYYADSRLVSATYVGKTAKYILTDMANHSNTGLTPDPNMPDGPTISAVQFDHVTLSDAADQISQLSSWQSDYAFYVGYDKVLYWGNELYALERVMAGTDPALTITDNVTGAPLQTRAYIDKAQQWLYEMDGSTLRNQTTVRGASKTATQTDTWQGDGTTTQWTLAFDLDQGGTVSLLVGGVSQTIEVSATPSSTTKQFALYQSPTGVWSLIKGTASVPGAGVTIALTYQASIPITQVYRLGTSVAQYAGPNGGVYEIFLADDTIKDAATALARARSETQQFGLAQERFTFSIVENWPGHLRAGQAVQIETSWVPDSQNAFNVGFTDWFVVIQNTINGTVGGRRRYDVVAVRINAGT